MRFLSPSWADLNWSPWISFEDPKSFKLLPPTPGMYRVRPAGQDLLVYLGQTGRDLRARLHALRRGTMAPEMPWNDPHTAAPSLWALRDMEGLGFECSAASIDLPEPEREALECYLLWQYRAEHGESTRCNHGRFHRRYVKSTDRKKAKRGYRLADGQPDNLAGAPGMPPLSLMDEPAGPGWMGLPWTVPQPLSLANLGQVPVGPGVYRILHAAGPDVVYIGESEGLRKRLSDHARKDWEGEAAFSFCHVPALDQSFKRHELENDLIGAYYAATRRAPHFQFRGHSRRRTAAEAG